MNRPPTETQLHHGLNWSGQCLAGWFVSEKYDGCRGYWDGSRMRSRSGREITLPDWFREQLPGGVALDGELWAGRGNFNAASVAVRLGRITPAIRFMAFDAPQAAGDWAQRMAVVAQALGAQPNVLPVRWQRVGSTVEALAVAAGVLAQDGEGIMARSPSDTAAAGRFDTLVKLKSARGWGEGAVALDRPASHCEVV